MDILGLLALSHMLGISFGAVGLGAWGAAILVLYLRGTL